MSAAACSTIRGGARDDLEVALDQRAEADSRYQILVERVPAAVYIDVADPGVTDGGRLAYMSPQIESILGYPPEAFIDDPELWPRAHRIRTTAIATLAALRRALGDRAPAPRSTTG